jgi:type IV pilus assembly protein PilY1
MKIYITFILQLFGLLGILPVQQAMAAISMNDYCSVPPFVSQSVPPLVMLVSSRDEKLYTQAYNDASDLDEDGRFDVGYVHSIEYYGYFDPYKCYTYSATSSTNGKFSPANDTADKFCSASGGQWSGNVLNWVTMSRMDVVRKVLYGGHRVTPESTGASATTVLERAYIPQDTHSWGKELTGKLCTNGTVYKSTCYNDLDCFTAYGTGYSCVDKSKQLIGMNASTGSVCPSAAITTPWNVSSKMLVATYWNYRSTGGTDHNDVLASYDTDTSNVIHTPLSLNDLNSPGTGGTSTMVDYISDFSAAVVDPTVSGTSYPNLRADYTSMVVIADFKTPNVSAVDGVWQFAIDGDDGVELEIIPGSVTATSTGTIVASYYGQHGAWFTGANTPNNTAFRKMCSLNQTQTCSIDADCTATSTGQCNYQQTSQFNTLLGTGGYTIAKNTTYRLIAREVNATAKMGVRVWYKLPVTIANPTPQWTLFGTDTSANKLTLSAPKILSGNECAIRFKTFVKNGFTTSSAGSAQRHLFCNTATSDGGVPLMRFLHDRPERIWQWASIENNSNGKYTMCGETLDTSNNGDASLSGSTSFTVDMTSFTDSTKLWDYVVRAEVCKTGTSLTREDNCRAYKDASNVITYKPSGLLQKYGEGVYGDKVCSRTYSKACTNDAGCTNTGTSSDEGLCIDKAPMYFGLMTGSYFDNINGGVLRKNFWSLTDEIDMTTGKFIVPASSSETDYETAFNKGSIINTFENFKMVGYDYSDHMWDASDGGTCGWFSPPLADGSCRMWGNPISEMMYESLRYIAGKSSPSAAFTANFSSTSDKDGSLPLFKTAWGVTSGSNTFRPYGDKDAKYAIFPNCSKPFMLVISEENNGYDSDAIPGSKFATVTEDAGLPQLNLNVATSTDIIGNTEGIEGSTVLIGEQFGGIADQACTGKTVSKLSLLRGLCPDAPTEQGSYYAAGVAYYAKTLLTKNTQQLNSDNTIKVNGKPNVTTSSVAMVSPVPKLIFNVGGITVNVVPTALSTPQGSCVNNCTMSTNADGSLGRSCTASAVCPGNDITAVYVEEMQYSNKNITPYTSANPAPNLVYARVRVNFNDAILGGDNDMDTIILYEICVEDACSPSAGAGNLNINVSETYAATSTPQMLGFIISGTSADGTYLVKNNTSPANSHLSTPPAFFANFNNLWTKTFTASSTSQATLLHSPLWYAAKWGGFNDSNAPTDATLLASYTPKPDLVGEWAKNDGVTPDNYYLVVNPLKLETQLDKALTDILARVSSGTASSILNNSQGSGANLLQAVFYPTKDFGGDNNKVNWIGEMQNLWYFVDPFFNRSTIRVDSNSDYSLDLNQDYTAKFYFNTSTNTTVVDLAQDVNGDGTSINSIATAISPDDSRVKSLWRAGRKLWERNVTSDPRKIYTVTSSSAFATPSLMLNNGTFNAAAANITLLQASDSTNAGQIIDFVSGKDQTGMRGRKVTISSCGLSDSLGCTREWKLGDIVNSTPRLISTVPTNSYSLAPSSGYGDSSYGQFTSSYNYKHRGMAFVGANDGMLHAFRLGILDESGQTKQHKARMLNTDGTVASSSSDLGREEWAFVPRNALPYLKYTADPNYNHLYYVDNTVSVFDASINAPSDNNNTLYPNCGSNYYNCGKHTVLNNDSTLNMANTSWRSILIGGMGFGGASRDTTTAASTTTGGCDDKASTGTCVKTPITGVGYSSYFALDVTNPHILFDDSVNTASRSRFLWEFNGDPDSTNCKTLGCPHYLGYATSGPAVVRVGAKDKNGRWFAVFASGPMGPIDTTSHTFYGKSDQNLKLFVVDVATGTLLRTIDTGIKNAFASSITNGVIDNDKWTSANAGFYSDDAVYIGYTMTADATPTTTSLWNKGGIIRLFTKEDTNPANWVSSTVIDGIGPVTTSIAKLQDRFAFYDKTVTSAAIGKLWLYFGSGRYFQKADSLTDQFKLYGLIEPCYSNNSGSPNFTPSGGTTNEFDTTCIKKVQETDMTDQSGLTTAVLKTLPPSSQGWYIKLDTAAGGFSSERSITNPVASTAGAVFFTTFEPTADVCGFGGNTYIWALGYDSGGAPPASAMQGKVLLQVSTGALKEVPLGTSFGTGTGPGTGTGTGTNRYTTRRTNDATSGMPPTSNGLALITNPRPVKKILHYQEK